jgi:DNA-binding response OmpR family regulator
VRGDGDPGQLPIVLLTAAHDPVQEPEVLHAGADVYMAKPFEAQALMVRINDVLAIPAAERGTVRRETAARLARGVAAVPGESHRGR